MIPKNVKQQILDTAKLTDLIPAGCKSGKDILIQCPFCKREGKGKGMSISPAKQIGKCFSSSCDESISGAADWLMKVENMSYPDALKELAKRYNIIIPDNETESERKKRVNHKRNKKSFCFQQLNESGLTREDITATLEEEGIVTKKPIFIQGTRDQYGKILPGRGDDMLIYYYDLEGKPTKYKRPKSQKYEHLVRVRWQNPAAHPDKNGKPIKYQSPAGSVSHLYIPHKIREKYKYHKSIDTLFIQEGEKKAEKACKHGINSVGIMGISNLGFNNQLPEDLQLIIQQCDVKNVVFLLDADWNQISSSLKNGDRVDLRPRSFFFAVKNYKEYIRTLVNLGISLEIYFGYIRENDKNDKGVDDLLAHSLKNSEAELKEDIQNAMHEKDGAGKFVKIHKITMLNDNQIADFWQINDHEAFAEKHKEKLKELKEFQISKIKYRFDENGKIEMAQKFHPSEQYWEETKRETKNGVQKVLNFDYVNCFYFLKNRGFARLKMKSGEWEFVHTENRVIKRVDSYYIKDFVTEFTEALKRKDVLNMLYRGGPQYLGPEKLSNLKYAYPVFEKAERNSQALFFKDHIWEISADGIKETPYAQMTKYVWSEKIIDFKSKSFEPMVKVRRIDKAYKKAVNDANLPEDEFIIELSEDAKKCDFLKFIMNASRFTWKADKHKDEVSIMDRLEDTRHFLNKMSVIGYLLHDYKNDSELKGAVAMDGKLSEVGASNGRTGKSLVGKAIEHVIPQVYISAKSNKLTDDPFIFGEVTEKTKNIFLDDVRANIDFEFFFPLITGKLKVNPKGGQPFTLEQEDTPKLLLTTNHAIMGEGSSYEDRQAFMVFSDFYNDDHKPIDDFKRNFFSEWDSEQWNLFYNFMASCLVVYFQTMNSEWYGRNQGIIPPPLESVELRKLRQQIGEHFLQWADAYYSWNGSQDDLEVSNLNKPIDRQDLYKHFLGEHPQAAKFTTPTSFGKKMRYYCRYRSLHFNPNMPNEKTDIGFLDWQNTPEAENGKSFIGTPYKTGGVEKMIVANKHYVESPF